jgi:hypothetical protein
VKISHNEAGKYETTIIAAWNVKYLGFIEKNINYRENGG